MRQTIQLRPASESTPSASQHVPPKSPLRDTLRSMDYASGEAVLTPFSGKETSGAKSVHQAAKHGTSGGGSELPFLDAIQTSFGGHDISGVKAHTGPKAQQGAEAMGAAAYASGNDVVFDEAPDMHTVAHEAAHIVQQRTGVALNDGVGQVGDRYEKQADEIADRVVRGESAEGLLGPAAVSAQQKAASPVQRKVEVNNLSGVKIEKSVPGVLKWLANFDEYTGDTSYAKMVEKDYGFMQGLKKLVETEEIHGYGFLQAADLIADIKKMSRIEHKDKKYDLDRTFRGKDQAKDAVYQVHDEQGTSVIKEGDDLASEADITEAVSGHENVINLLDRANDDSTIRLEYAPNGSLDKYDVDSETKAQKLAKGIIEGLAHVNDQGVAHCDLGLANIFLGGTKDAPIAKLADFGQSKQGLEAFKNIPSDIAGGIQLLKRLTHGLQTEDALDFQQACTTLASTALELVHKASSQLQDPEEQAHEMGFQSLEEMISVLGEAPPQVELTQEEVIQLRQSWKDLTAHRWLSNVG